MSTPSAAQRLVGGVNRQSRGVRVVIRHGLFSCVYGVSADTAASTRYVFWTRSFSEVFGAYPEVLGIRAGPQTKINYTNWTV